MPNIDIQIKQKIAALYPSSEGAKIVCGNSDYTIKFDFDEEWSEHPNKIAVFSYNRGGEWTTEQVMFEGDTVNVPVLKKVRFVEVGVIAGNISTSTPARITCLFSASDRMSDTASVSPDILAQILDKLDNIKSATPDWFQSDPEADDYIKNRIGGYYDEAPVEWASYTPSDVAPMYAVSSDIVDVFTDYKIEEGQEFEVVIDGVAHKHVACVLWRERGGAPQSLTARGNKPETKSAQSGYKTGFIYFSNIANVNSPDDFRDDDGSLKHDMYCGAYYIDVYDDGMISYDSQSEFVAGSDYVNSTIVINTVDRTAVKISQKYLDDTLLENMYNARGDAEYAMSRADEAISSASSSHSKLYYLYRWLSMMYPQVFPNDSSLLEKNPNITDFLSYKRTTKELDFSVSKSGSFIKGLILGKTYTVKFVVRHDADNNTGTTRSIYFDHWQDTYSLMSWDGVTYSIGFNPNYGDGCSTYVSIHASDNAERTYEVSITGDFACFPSEPKANFEPNAYFCARHASYLRSPNGKIYKLTVSDDGTLSTTLTED